MSEIMISMLRFTNFELERTLGVAAVMDKNDTGKTVKNEAWLTVSDWVTFLTSEKYGIMSNVLNFGVLLVALIAIALSTRGNTAMQAIGNGIFAFALLGFVYFKVFRPFEKRGKLAQGILDRVMSGKLKNESSIRKEWEDGLTTFKRAQRRRGQN